MKKILICFAILFFVCAPLLNAAQWPETPDAPRKSTGGDAPKIPDTPAAPTQPQVPVPIPGMMAAGGMGQDMIPVVRESADVIEELVKIIEASNLAGKNADLINRAKEIVKRGEDAISAFTGTMGAPMPSSPVQQQ